MKIKQWHKIAIVLAFFFGVMINPFACDKTNAAEDSSLPEVGGIEIVYDGPFSVLIVQWQDGLKEAFVYWEIMGWAGDGWLKIRFSNSEKIILAKMSCGLPNIPKEFWGGPRLKPLPPPPPRWPAPRPSGHSRYF